MYKFDYDNHLHSFDGKPLIGTSTACKIIAKPLTWWASGMACAKLGWTNSKIRVNGKYQSVSLNDRLRVVEPVKDQINGLTPTEYLSLLDEAYNAHNVRKEEAAEAGTDRHAILEGYVKDCIKHGGTPEDTTVEDIKSFVEWAKKNIKKFLWSELHGYSSELWTGGIADVGWIDMQDRIVAGDFKSSKEAWFDQFIQVAGYDIMISENGGFTADGEKIFTLENPIQAYCVVPFGNGTLTPKVIYDIESFKEGFRSAVRLHKLNQSYNEL